MKKMILLLLVAAVSFALAGQSLRIGIDETTAPYGPIVKEIYADAGIEVELIVQPGARSLESANNGTVDGECFRIPTIGDTYTNLRIIPTPLTTVLTSAYCLADGPIIESPADLVGKKVAVIRGHQAATALAATAGTPTVFASSVENLFKILTAKRADVIITAETSGNLFIDEYPNVVLQSPPLINISLHLWLHKKHADLIPAIDAVIREWGEAKVLQRMNVINNELQND